MGCDGRTAVSSTKVAVIVDLVVGRSPVFYIVNITLLLAHFLAGL